MSEVVSCGNEILLRKTIIICNIEFRFHGKLESEYGYLLDSIRVLNDTDGYEGLLVTTNNNRQYLIEYGSKVQINEEYLIIGNISPASEIINETIERDIMATVISRNNIVTIGLYKRPAGMFKTGKLK